MDEDYGKMMCIGCGEPIPVVRTAYGERMVCQAESRRWTRLNNQRKWVEEKCNVMEGWWLDGEAGEDAG